MRKQKEAVDPILREGPIAPAAPSRKSAVALIEDRRDETIEMVGATGIEPVTPPV